MFVRRQAQTLDIFFDDVIIGSLDVGTTAIVPSPEPLLIGRRNLADGRVFGLNGRMDEIAIWNRALSNAEIAYLYNGGAGNPVPEPGTLALLVLGCAGISIWRRKNKR